MTRERWRQIEELYHAARERGRGVLADVAPDLRDEVERLLGQDSTGKILDQPAAEILGDATPTEIAPGAELGPYRIQARMGAGGMGEVFRAIDTRLDREVAIKTCREQFSDRFHREARAISSLNHPHICTLHDVGRNYLVMELIEGETLAARLKRGKLPIEQTVEYGSQMADALEAAHAKGIIHRDLKPGNIMIANSGIKILDFGLAKSALDETLTASRVVMGTPAYMAPEQREGEECDARSDIYALGLVLFETATGKRFAPGSAPSTGLPQDLERIIGKCLETDRELRYQHASEVRTDLRRLRRDAHPVRLAGTTKPRGSRLLKISGAAAAALLALVLADHFHLRGAPKLTEKDTVVLGEFENRTGDPVFDDTLRQGLAVQLEQSPFLSLISEQRVRHTLQLMGQPAGTRLTSEVAQEVCERTASAATLEGSIAPLGSEYVLGLRATNCRTGEVLDEEQMQARRKEDVLNALTRISSRFRTRVGESLPSVKRNDTPLEEATTSSLEALKAFSRAMKVDFSSGEAAAIPLFKRATEIDPNFALAYGNLGLSYSGVGDTVLAIQSTTRAYELRDRVSEREKFFITAMYERHVTGDLEKERHTLELWAQSYPRDPKPHGLLSGYGSQGTGRYERAIEEAKTTIGLDPDFTFAYLNAVSSSIYLDRLDDAQKMLGAASRRGIEVPGFLFFRYVIAFLRGDRDGMRREVARAKDRRGGQELVAQAEALVLARSGQLRAARARSLEAINLAQEEGDPERRATCLTGAAVSDAFFGNAMAAKRSAMEALKVSNGRDVEYAAAFALALAGDSTRPGALANDLEKRFPEDTFVNFTYVPILHALASLQQSKPADAVEQLQVALPYELAIPPIAFDGGSFGALYGAYVRGLAYLAEHQGAQAALEFQKLLEHRGLLGVDPAGATARLQLGRALALCGDRDKAKAAYQDFFTLWKDADPDIPILNQAKAEYIRL